MTAVLAELTEPVGDGLREVRIRPLAPARDGDGSPHPDAVACLEDVPADRGGLIAPPPHEPLEDPDDLAIKREVIPSCNEGIKESPITSVTPTPWY
jgi:hypothetical protein